MKYFAKYFISIADAFRCRQNMYERRTERRPSMCVELHACLYACVRARWSVRRWRRAFPFRIAKVQRAIPRCAYFYIRAPVKLALARNTNNLSEKKKQRNTRGTHLRNDSTVSSPTSLPLFFVLVPFRESSFAESRKPDPTENFRKAVRCDFSFIKSNAGSNFSVIFLN